MTKPTQLRLADVAQWYLWAAAGGRDAAPGRLPVLVCDACGCLVAADKATDHRTFHLESEDDIG